MKLSNLAMVAGLGLACVFSPASAQSYTDEEFARITQGVDAFLDQLEASDDFSPGSVVVISTADGRRYVRADGELIADSGQAATPDSQFYIASMTKSYMGLLAVRLDAEGILSLDTTLADVWPTLTMPEGVDPSAITMRLLLSHQLGFDAGEIAMTEAYIRDLAPEEYPTYLEQYAEATEPGYRYSNVGYNVYAAILEQTTGRNWRDWLADYIFDPLEMTGTSGRVSDFPAEDVAWGHQRYRGLSPFWPHTDDWYLVQPKTDEQMQSAGGLMTTGTDFAIWMEANLQHDIPGFTDDMFDTAHTTVVGKEADGDGFSCPGYSFGWETCEYLHLGTAADGSTPPPVDVLQHGGGYTGFGSMFTLAPDLGIGVAIARNSDGPMFYADLEISKLVFELALNLESIEERNATRLERFALFNERFTQIRASRMEENLAEEMWGEGGWSPEAGDLAEFEGSFHSDDYFVHDFTVTVEDGALVLRADSLMRHVAPISEDIFGAYGEPVYPPEILHFIRDETGAITSVDWDGEIYTPVAD